MSEIIWTDPGKQSGYRRKCGIFFCTQTEDGVPACMREGMTQELQQTDKTLFYSQNQLLRNIAGIPA